MADGAVLSVMTGVSPSAALLDTLKTQLTEALTANQSELLSEVGFEVVPAWAAPAAVVQRRIGGQWLPLLAEHPDALLVFAFVEVPAGNGQPCPCCERPT